MKMNLRALIPLMIILVAALGAHEGPAEEEAGETDRLDAQTEAAAPDSLAPTHPESLLVKVVDGNHELVQRSRLAARSLAVTLRVGKRLLGAWLETLLSQPTRKG